MLDWATRSDYDYDMEEEARQLEEEVDELAYFEEQERERDERERGWAEEAHQKMFEGDAEALRQECEEIAERYDNE